LVLHHDDAAAHRALSSSIWPKKSVTEVEHPTCSPDMAPNDFWLFPKIESALKGRNFRILQTSKK